MKLLTLDTNTSLMSCCITENENLISELNIFNFKNHSINSISTIDSVIKNSNLNLQDIDGFVLSKGPGSFTGLRIAFSIIKAFSFSLNKPMISISSLDCLGFRENFNGIVCAIMDALRNEIYVNSFSSKDEIVKNNFEGNIVHIDNLKKYLNEKHQNANEILFCGSDCEKFEIQIKSQFPKAFINKKPSTAYDYALLGFEKFKLNLFDDVFSSSPNYIRVSQAQENLILKNNNLT